MHCLPPWQTRSRRYEAGACNPNPPPAGINMRRVVAYWGEGTLAIAAASLWLQAWATILSILNDGLHSSWHGLKIEKNARSAKHKGQVSKRSGTAGCSSEELH